MGILSSVGPRPRVARRSPDSGGGRTLAVRNLCSAPPGTSRRCPLDGTSGFVRPVCSGRGHPPLPPARGSRAWSAWKVRLGRLLPRGLEAPLPRAAGEEQLLDVYAVTTVVSRTI